MIMAVPVYLHAAALINLKNEDKPVRTPYMIDAGDAMYKPDKQSLQTFSQRSVLEVMIYPFSRSLY